MAQGKTKYTDPVEGKSTPKMKIPALLLVLISRMAYNIMVTQGVKG
jgi:hypothetical protein